MHGKLYVFSATAFAIKATTTPLFLQSKGGDAGIEGFTNKGIVHQCYCPERPYSDNELYTHQREKLTTDIEKLMKNANRLRALGVPPVTEWHLNIPEYKDSRILAHAEAKRQEVIKAKKDKPIQTMYTLQTVFVLSLKQRRTSHQKSVELSVQR